MKGSFVSQNRLNAARYYRRRRLVLCFTRSGPPPLHAVAPAAELSPHHKAVIAALERLTGKKNVAPTAAAWAEAVKK